MMTTRSEGESGGKPQIVIFAEASDTPAKNIASVLKALGAAPSIVSLKVCGFDSRLPHGLHIPTFEGDLPHGAIVRNVPSGSFEQVTMRLGLLHALREHGVKVWNDARAIECCIDKSMTTHLLVKAGLASPETITVQSHKAAAAIVAHTCSFGKMLVFKPLFGSQGNGLKLIRSVDDLPPEEDVAGVYYLQRFVEPEDDRWQDYRLFVVGGSVIAAMARVGQSWITNVKQGAEPHALVPGLDMIETAIRAARAVGADYAGVDLIRGRCGTLYTLEVNSMPAWSGLEAAHPSLSVAAIIAERFVNALRAEGVPWTTADEH
jgi:tetrahydromethanopterin:alpha-L-glutamate ligase